MVYSSVRTNNFSRTVPKRSRRARRRKLAKTLSARSWKYPAARDANCSLSFPPLLNLLFHSSFSSSSLLTFARTRQSCCCRCSRRRTKCRYDDAFPEMEHEEEDDDDVGTKTKTKKKKKKKAKNSDNEKEEV